MKFVLKVFPDGRYLVGGLSAIHPEWDFIWAKDQRTIELYYARLDAGGILAGDEVSPRFDYTPVGNAWLHVKPAKGVFPYVPYVITISRKEHIRKELAKFGIKYKLIEGIEHETGSIGLSLTMMHIFSIAKGDVMIIEDDCKFIRNPLTFDVREMPDDWDVIFFGANIKTSCDEGNAYCSRLIKAWTTHCVLYRKAFVQRILTEYDPYALPIDEWLSQRMPETKMYVTNPFYAIQKDGYSLIEKKPVDYAHIFNSQKYLT